MAPFRLRHHKTLACSFFEAAFVLVFMLAPLSLLASLNIHGAPIQDPLLPTALLTALGVGASLYAFRRLAPASAAPAPRRWLLPGLLALAAAAMAAAVHALLTTEPAPGARVLWSAVAAGVAVPLALAVRHRVASRWRILEARQERALILGAGPKAQSALQWIRQNLGSEYTVLGFVSVEQASRASGGRALPVSQRRTTRELEELRPEDVDVVIVALEEKRGVLPVDALVRLRTRGIRVEDAASFIERHCGRIAIDHLLPSWLVFSDGFRVSGWRRFAKRASDLFLASLLLVLTAPLMALIYLAVRLESPGDALYRQERVGMGGKTFWLIKFRSMRNGAEKGGPQWATVDDPRVTRVGRILRRYRMDELPQLFNVLKGEMSFVGPRPERPVFVEKLRREIPYYDLRHSVRPGITGWAQIQHEYGASIEQAKEKLQYDLFYIKNCGLRLDCYIVFRTVAVVLSGAGAR